jgi:hypothetical protein
VTNAYIQSKIVDAPIGDSKVCTVSGVLGCAASASSMEEYKKYMHFNAVTDSSSEWIIAEMMSDIIPRRFTQHLTDHSVYWVEQTESKSVSTWKHPHYDKYMFFLKRAREIKPLPDMKNRIIFQLFNQIDPPKDEISIEHVIEISRIFKTNLVEEPFLFHLIIKIIRQFYGISNITANFESKTSHKSSADDYLKLIQQERELFADLCASVSDMDKRPGMNCIECSENIAINFCKNCDDYFCEKCFSKIHSSGCRLEHKSIPIELAKCSECSVLISSILCDQCGDFFCYNCYDTIHCRGGRRHHIPIIISSMKTGSLPYLNSVKLRLDKMKSPWIALNQNDGGTIYYNVAKNFEPNRDIYGLINSM